MFINNYFIIVCRDFLFFCKFGSFGGKVRYVLPTLVSSRPAFFVLFFSAADSIFGHKTSKKRRKNVGTKK